MKNRILWRYSYITS